MLWDVREFLHAVMILLWFLFHLSDQRGGGQADTVVTHVQAKDHDDSKESNECEMTQSV